MKNISKQVTKPVDEYLKFVQQSFNTSDFKFTQALRELEAFNKNSAKSKEVDRALEIAEDLIGAADHVDIIKDDQKYKKFDKLGTFGFDKAGLLETYQLAEDIIIDVKTARDWLDSYKEFKKRSLTANTASYEATHEELIILGKSILGRAVEMTPIKTGFLRESGSLFDFGNYIIIAFTAPYASYVHENLSIAHPIHADNHNCYGRAKFLEIALQEFFPDRSVWIETEGFSGVSVKIAMNPLYIEYKHYGGIS